MRLRKVLRAGPSCLGDGPFDALVGGWGNLARIPSGGLNVVFDMAEWAEDLALAENVERFAGEALEGETEENESDVAVFGAGAGICDQRSGERGAAAVHRVNAPSETTFRTRVGRTSGRAACEK